ncbi:ABC transporter permease [Treponema sp. OMZ 855]|uniref:ABC transporter permease n=1 Tax=Treponema sp. OMZ 855 TaxID=1643512 RepID=UPI0020A60C88|nr:ABC transporter permease [Treponema sp. OMZ 855]UTC49986.1 ABC transporter permease [Treponema sp. OMZ 855]
MAVSEPVKKLTVIELAKQNLKRKPFRTVSLIVLTAVLAFSLFAGSFLVKSLNGGMQSLSNRLGADIIVVPQGYDSKIESALLRGEPNSFYFKSEVVDRLKKIEGVDLASPQLFIATLSAGCCSFPLQVIGIDFDSDFNIKPWLERQIRLPLTDNQIVVGSNIVGDTHSEVKFFNQPFVITGRLAKTGMGFDNSVFMTIENAKRLAKEYERIMEHPVAHDEDLISSVMVRIKPNADVKTVAQRILTEFEGEQIYPLISKLMMTNISASIVNLNVYIYVLLALLWLLSFIVLAVSFSSIFHERKEEFGMLRIIGGTKKKLAQLASAEAFIISASGAGIGTVLSCLIVLLFNQAIIAGLKMPFLTPPVLWILLCALSTLLAISLIGPLAALKTIHGFTKQEPALQLQG